MSDDNLQIYLGRKYKSKIKSLYTILLFIKEHYNRKSNTIEICQNNKELQSVYTNVNDAKRYLEEAYVIKAFTDSYFKGKYSKKYYVNVDNLEYLMSLSKQLGGFDERKKDIDTANTYKTDINEEDDYDDENDYIAMDSSFLGISNTKKSILDYKGKCDIGSRLLIDKIRYDCSQLEHRVRIDNPLLGKYQSKVEEINKTIDIKREIIKYELKARPSALKYIDEEGKKHYPNDLTADEKRRYKREFGKYIVKIGARANSQVCILESKEKQRAVFGDAWVEDKFTEYREDYLDCRFGAGWEEYDVHASVPRIAHYLQDKDNDFGNLGEDIYTTLFGKYYSIYDSFIQDNGFENTNNARTYYKSLFLRLYFTSSPKLFLNQIIQSEERQIERQKERREKAEIERKPFMEPTIVPFWSILKQRNDKKAEEFATVLKGIVDNYCLPTNRKLIYNNGSKIFIHESNIYINVRLALLDRGIDVVQVYDGFYFKKGTMPKDMDDIIIESARKYKVELFRSQIKDELRLLDYRTKYPKKYYIEHLDDPRTNIMLVTYFSDIIERIRYFGTESLDGFFQWLLDQCPTSKYMSDGTIDNEFEINVVDKMCGYVIEMRHLFDCLEQTIFYNASVQ